jgi:hypothetical protein
MTRVWAPHPRSLARNSGDEWQYDVWALTATPAEGYFFKQYERADGSAFGVGNQSSSITIAQDTDVVAVFRDKYTFSCVAADETMGTVTCTYNSSYGA